MFLQSTYQSAIADGVIGPKESVQLYNATLGVLNSANITVSEIQAVVVDLQAITSVWVG